MAAKCAVFYADLTTSDKNYRYKACKSTLLSCSLTSLELVEDKPSMVTYIAHYVSSVAVIKATHVLTNKLVNVKSVQ